MTAINEDVERLLPPSDEWPLLRGLLIGAAVGATVVGLVILGRTIQARREARRRPFGGTTPQAPLGAEPSPL